MDRFLQTGLACVIGVGLAYLVLLRSASTQSGTEDAHPEEAVELLREIRDHQSRIEDLLIDLPITLGRELCIGEPAAGRHPTLPERTREGPVLQGVGVPQARSELLAHRRDRPPAQESLSVLDRWKEDRSLRERWLLRSDESVVAAFGIPHEMTATALGEQWLYRRVEGGRTEAWYRFRIRHRRVLGVDWWPEPERDTRR